MKLSIFGLGYVGSTTAACLAELGHHVIGVDVNQEKVAMVNAGESPVYEPGVKELLSKHRARGAVHATVDAAGAAGESDACLVCVGTPSDLDGALDESQLIGVIEEIAHVRRSRGQALPILVRSTALPEKHDRIIRQLERERAHGDPIAYAVHPEFLRAGEAVSDFMNPPKIIFGCTDNTARAACDALYPGIGASVFHTDPMTAAFVKYADNCFHAVKVTFANEMGLMAKSFGVDARTLMELFCEDRKLNISDKYLRPGFAFGGSCLPKDLRATLASARRSMITAPMLENVLVSNDLQVKRLTDRVLHGDFDRIGLFGLAFKANTDDLRESPMVRFAEACYGRGKVLRIYEPGLRVARMMGTNLSYAMSRLPHLAQLIVDDPHTVVEASDAVVVARTFGSLPWADFPWRSEHQVFDLVGDGSLSDIGSQVEGLYW